MSSSRRTSCSLCEGNQEGYRLPPDPARRFEEVRSWRRPYRRVCRFYRPLPALDSRSRVSEKVEKGFVTRSDCLNCNRCMVDKPRCAIRNCTAAAFLGKTRGLFLLRLPGSQRSLRRQFMVPSSAVREFTGRRTGRCNQAPGRHSGTSSGIHAAVYHCWRTCILKVHVRDGASLWAVSRA